MQTTYAVYVGLKGRPRHPAQLEGFYPTRDEALAVARAWNGRKGARRLAAIVEPRPEFTKHN